MEYDTKVANFCEKKIYPNQPEYINAFSALFLCYISIHNLTKDISSTPQTKSKQSKTKQSKTKQIINWCIFTNGISSFLYHWYNWYIFKMADEFTMIIPIWLGITYIIYNLNYHSIYIGIFTIYNMLLITLEPFMWFDKYFPVCFGIELFLIFPLYIQTITTSKYKNIRNHSNHSNQGLKGIIVIASSATCWIITETHCNKYLIFGHAIWHIGMGTGMTYIINFFNYKIRT